MISRRIVINLVAFVMLFAALCVWAVRSIIYFDFIERPYHVTAEFETSPGLRPDFEVTYLGVRIGNISSVELADDRVIVDLAIDRGTEVPANVSAAVRRKSAVGEPYVDLSPPETARARGAGAALESGDVIPLERTSVPLSYGELFEALDELVSAVPPDDLDTLVHELALGLQGRSEAIRRLVEGASDLTGTLASRDDLLDQLSDDLTQLTHTLAEHRDAFGSSVDNLALLAETLAGTRGDLVRLLDDGPGFTDRVADLMARSEGDLGCTLDSLGTIAERLAGTETLRNLAAVLDGAASTTAVVDDVIVHTGEDGAHGPYIDAGFSMSALPVSPDRPPPLGDPVGRRSCTETGKGPIGAAETASEGQGAGAAAGAGASDAEDTNRPERGEISEGASSAKEVDDGSADLGRFVLPLLLLAALGLLATRPWRFLAGLGKRGDRATGPAALDTGSGDATTELEAEHETEDLRT